MPNFAIFFHRKIRHLFFVKLLRLKNLHTNLDKLRSSYSSLFPIYMDLPLFLSLPLCRLQTSEKLRGGPQNNVCRRRSCNLKSSQPTI